MVFYALPCPDTAWPELPTDQGECGLMTADFTDTFTWLASACRFATDWPWCHEEWAGGDEGGMEVYTCYCKEELCNQNSFLLPKFNEWISVTRARLKAGPSHPLDIVLTLATVGVGGFFLLIVISNIPWGKLVGNKGEKDDENDEEDDDDVNDDANEEDTSAHTKNE